jgi:hypothetical protein
MITFKVETKGLAAMAARIAGMGKQVKFATAKSLTRTAWAVAKAERQEVDRAFDRPTKFVQNAFRVEQATPVNLTATVSIKPKQAAILLPHIKGGRRGQKGFERKLASEARADGYWVPGAGVKLNAHGNMTLATIKQIAAGLQRSGKYGDVFVGVPKGMPSAPFGIWARVTRGRGKKATGAIKPLLIKINQPNYRKRFDFYGVAQRTVSRTFRAEFDKTIADAIRTAR